jgi:aspartyl-tRNA(Asn)/glutamyl-tRNA(Gln) amidotransferase subunit C
VAISTENVESLAQLARLGLDEDALAPLASDLSKVLDLVEKLQAIDTEGVEAMAHPAGASLWLRDDEVTHSDQRDTLQEPAPSLRDGYFLVPRVIE